MARPEDPWVRWGWLMAAVWLVFLIFPIADALTTDRSWSYRVLCLVVIAAFVLVYVHGFVRADTIGSPGRLPQWWPVGGLGLLVALTVASLSLQGGQALGLVIYTIAYAMFLTPVRLAVPLAVGALTLVTVLAVLADGFDGLEYFLPVMIAVTVAMGVTRFLEERGEAARELTEEINLVTERERVARDVHDVLGHSLTVVAAKAELAERLLEQDPDRAHAELVDIQSLTREALGEIRATVAGLRVTRLGDELAAARAALATAGITATVPDDPAMVDPRHRLVLAWVLREAVTNVVRHSGATTCEVELSRTGLVVRDDGRGRAGAPPGNGLRGVAERVRGAGGRLTVRDGDGAGAVAPDDAGDARPTGSPGTVLEVTWP